MGDASLIKPCRNAYLKLQHGPEQRVYLMYKVALLEKLTSVNVRDIEDNGYGYKTYIAETKVHPVYTKLWHRWYGKGRKAITKKAIRSLNEEGLAYWYMDDGSLTIHHRLLKDGTKSPKGREVHFHTQSFTYNEHEILRDFLHSRFGIDMNIVRHKSRYWILGCGAGVGNKLFDIIKPYIIPLFNYKINMLYQVR